MLRTVEDDMREANALIDDDKLPEAAALIERSLQDFPVEGQLLFYCLLCIHSIAQDKPKVLDTFERAVRAGVWWSPSMVSADADFAWLLKDADFEAQLTRMQTLLNAARRGAHVRIKDFRHGPGPISFVNLHKKNNSTERMLGYFEESNKAAGINTRYVQASQVDSSNGFSWDDVDLSLNQVSAALADIADQPLVLCGTSQGGNIAFLQALATGKDYLGVMPAIKPETLARMGAKPKGRFVFLVGDEDPYRGNVMAAHERLLELGTSSIVRTTGAIGHWLPHDFSRYYADAVAELIPAYLGV